ncbi:Riboflavin transporter FmnP [Acetitomaculum ruminis DSM 5522]|uniref:Riboflavin transporter n=1 Tax=Acetitomaculum ruminis DSM 5522 TaxID=1120918 RepID=A0A1I1AHT4_9FIRM|nr:ECF transporter S component [Acetitomaculum ruminis]SFB37564.1 Riboflavin transporter FmnP [Acetitomaculum ruminis DSM 5522]
MEKINHKLTVEEGTRRSGKVRKLTMTAMLSALSAVLMFFSFNVPLMPSFIKMDLSELPALIGAFTMGPISGVAICLVKNLVNLTATTTGGVGELCNFILGACFVLPAGLIYKVKKSKNLAIFGAFAGAVFMAVLSVPINYFVTYPIYTAFIPMETILAMYQAIYPKVDNLLQALLIFNMPFTFVKGMIDVAITIVTYKYLSPIIKGNTID